MERYSKIKVKKNWEKVISENLVGKKITKVEYLSVEEVVQNGWNKTPIAIELDGKYWLIPMMDDERNDGGSVSTTMSAIPTIPTI